MGRYIVIDLTRFKEGNDDVCTAVIDMETGECLRPMPYLKGVRVRELNMHPGAVLEGEITKNIGAENPHIEDASYRDLKYKGPASGEEFKAFLERTLSDSVASGFGVPFGEGQKHIPAGQQAACSIITIRILPRTLTIHEDAYKPGRIKVSFTDNMGHSYRYLPITDRGFYDYAKKHQDDGQLDKVQSFILSQEEVYLRIGVSRQYQSGDRNGYWLQVNGIYTFPSFYKEIRKY